jgi:bifunctional DNase/RNase
VVEVEVADVKVDLRSNSPVLLLQELEPPYRVIPIFIGVPEANAIELFLRRVEAPRPLTHDLMRILVEELDGQLERAVVTELRNGTYYAELVLSSGGIERKVSARPSDAVALALRMGAPIYVSDAIMNAEGTVLEEELVDGEEKSEDQIVGQFRAFLNSIKPEDFSEE